jgi:thiosulfate reductase cytochrome b subunit
VGELSLAIDLEKYQDSVHGDMACIDCHYDIEAIPHKQRLDKVDCSDCHEVEAVQASAHGEDAEKKVGCVGCHDVHYSQGAGEYEEEWKTKYCMECHEKYGMDNKDAHKDLYEFELHKESLGCMACHQGETPGTHNIAKVSDKVANCEACHSKYSILTDEMYKPAESIAAYYSQTSFINASSLKEYGYVVGSHRIPLLDLIVILLVIGPVGLPIVHGGLRALTRRKEPVELPEEKILLHPLLERLWHWAQALCIVMLIITGIIIHWPEYFTGWFDWAVSVHNWFGIATVVLFLIWLFYNIFSGRITHYVPNKGDIPKRVIVQAKFYGYGIFKHEPHPYPPREDDKFNPLQKLAYLSFQVLLMPILLISGILYMYPETFSGVIDSIGGMTTLGLIHYILGALFASFLVAHLYLATTGETIGENFKAIITGYGIKEEHGHGDGHDDEVKKA